MFSMLFSRLFIWPIEFFSLSTVIPSLGFLNHNQTNYVMYLNRVIYLFPSLHMSKTQSKFISVDFVSL